MKRSLFLVACGLFCATLTTMAPNITATSAQADSLGNPTIAAVGDMACDPANKGFNRGAGTSIACGENRVSDAMLADTTIDGGVLGLGDYQYDCGDAADYAVSYDPTWGRLDPKFDATVAGNHEYKTGTDKYGSPCPSSNTTAAGYFTRFDFTTNASIGSVSHPDTQGHFSFDLGSWHLIALNGNCKNAYVGGCSATSAQTQWLRADLTANTQPCVLAFWHQPLFTGVGTGKMSAYRRWWDVLYSYGADVVLNGHVHNYQRFNPMNSSGVLDPRGITEYIAGTGGEDQNAVTAGVTPTPAASAKTFGYLRMTLLPGGWTEDFVDYNGSVLDNSAGTCH